jgi:hypothetical protein
MILIPLLPTRDTDVRETTPLFKTYKCNQYTVNISALLT